MRKKLFFACLPADNIQKEIQEIISSFQSNLTTANLPVKWVQGQQFYIKLAYLGAVSNEAQAAAEYAASLILPQLFPFETSIGALSYYFKGEKGRGSEIFLTFEDKEKNFRNLHKILSNALKEKGFSPAGHFVPYTTIGLLKRQRHEHEQMQMLDTLARIELPKEENFIVDSIYLVENINDELLAPKISLVRNFPFKKV